MLQEPGPGIDANASKLGRTIAQELAAGRRDSQHVPPGAIPCGFAGAPDFSCVLFRRGSGAPLEVAIEWSAFPLRAAPDLEEKPGSENGEYEVIDWSASNISLRVDAAIRRLRCYVAFAPESTIGGGDIAL
jgi:hypothetical protein